MRFERIVYQEKLLAIILGNDYVQDGIHFFTPDDFSQQLAYMKRPQGYVIDPHVHNPIPRQVAITQEVLLIKKGRVRVDFYNDDQLYLESRVISAGDVILLARGGHGFVMLEESEIIEVKQGPYAGEQEKTRFKTAPASDIQIKERSES